METAHFVSAGFDNYPLSVVGEESYQDAIQNIVGHVDDNKKSFREVGFSAELILEDNNIHDPNNAVRVDIDGETVGYLSKANAAIYRKALKTLGVPQVVGACNAAIFGKRGDENEEMNFGVWLDIELENIKILPGRSAITPAQPSSKQTKAVPISKSKNKIPFIPVKGKGCLFFLFVLPIILSINLLILMLAGIWFAVKWVWEIATSTPQSKKVSLVIVGAFTTLCVGSALVSALLQAVGIISPATPAPTVDLVVAQNTAIAEAWLASTQTAAAMPTFTSLPTDTAAPPSTPTLITISTATTFLQILPVNQTPTLLPAQSAVCSCSGNTLNCSDFSTHSKAQACYDYCISQGVGDIHKLDGNPKNGLACESLP